MRVLGQLGGGASATVWQVQDLGGRLAALKIAKHSHGATLVAEASAALCLVDAALPRLLDVGQLDAGLASDPKLSAQGLGVGSTYSMWEHLPGIDAHRLATPTSEQVAWIFRDVCRALAHLHESDLSHGDVKPANIRVDTAGQRAWLLDLGLCRHIQVAIPSGATPRYLDQNLVGSNGRQRDLYALGFSLLELLHPDVSAPAGELLARYKLRSQQAGQPRDALRGTLLKFADQLVHPHPGRRPHAHFLWRELCRALGEPDPELAVRPERVAASYLALRRYEVSRAASTFSAIELSSPSREWVAPWLPIAASLSKLRTALGAATDAGAIAAGTRGEARDESAPAIGSSPLRPLDAAGNRRWLVALIGAEAASFPDFSLAESELAQRIAEHCSNFPVATIGAHEIGSQAAPPEIPKNLQGLALCLHQQPSSAALAAGEQLLVRGDAADARSELRAEPELRAALAAALRRRGEYSRAQAILEAQTDDSLCGAELAECQRRAGQLAEASATCQLVLSRLSGPSALSASDAAAAARAQATSARVALTLGEIELAEGALAAAAPAFSTHEARALLSMTLHARARVTASEVEQWITAAERAARSAEERARAAGLRGYFAHARGAAEAACTAFELAVELAGRAGSLPEEATYLTGLAAAASDAGLLGRALSAAERASLMFEYWGSLGQAARAQLNLAAALIGCGAWSQAAEALARTSDLATRSVDTDCFRLATINHAELHIGRLSSAAELRSEDAEQARQALAEARTVLDKPSGAERLLLGALGLRLTRALGEISDLPTLDLAQLDELARNPELPPGPRLEWWRSRAEQLSAPTTPSAGRGDAVLRELLALLSAQGPMMSRGPACAAGAELAARLGRGDEARRLTLASDACARHVLHNIPEEHKNSARGLPWLAALAASSGVGDASTNPLAAAQLAKLEQAVRSLGERASLRALLNQVLDALVLWTGVERGLLLLRAPEGRLKVRVARNLSREDLSPHQRELSMSLAKRALSAREPVVAVDASGELPEHTESVHALNLRSVLAVPLIARGEVLGVVYLDDRERRGAFGHQELAWVRLLGSVAAIAIAEARDQLWLRRAARRAERAASRLSDALSTERHQLLAARRELGARAHPEIVGDSPALLELLRLVGKVADTDLPVLILGASGTGKELIARAIHADSSRSKAAFVAENCAAVPETLLESTLFGHVRGAFTGADRNRVGLFELADGGSLFLDEIGEMSLGMQAKLLRVLERGEVRPVGSNKTMRVDVRTIAATHRDLPQLVASGEFREDLFYRLEVFTLRVPSLADRRTDIRLLAEHFIRHHSQAEHAPRLTNSALDALEHFSWPGNVRQLENELRRALVLCGDSILPEHFSRDIAEPTASPSLDLKQATERVERRLLVEALEQTHGNQTRAAKLLGVSRFGLQKMLKRLELNASAHGTHGAESKQRETGSKSQARSAEPGLVSSPSPKKAGRRGGQ